MALGVVTVNVNGVRATARRGGLDWIKAQLDSGEVQVICLQEVRATTEQLLEELDKVFKSGSGITFEGLYKKVFWKKV